MRLAALLALVVSAPSVVAADADWPQFRGPNRDGVSPDTGLLKAWPEGGPKLLWKSDPVGNLGYSSVAVVGDLVVTMGDVMPDGKDPANDKQGSPEATSTVFAVERATGKLKWKAPVGPSGPGGVGGAKFYGSRSTPTVDKEAGLVFAPGQMGQFVCLQLKDGKEVWKVDLVKDYEGKYHTWNYSESVLVDGDKVICTPGGSKATLLALDKKTGKEVWKGVIPGGDSAGYASIMVSKAAGVKQYVTLLSNRLVGFSEDGKLLWEYGTDPKKFGRNVANIPTPIIEKDQVFATTGYGRGTALLTLSSSGGKVEVKEEYFVSKPTNKHGGVVKVGDYVYGDAGDGGLLCCVEFKTGKEQWTRDRNDAGKGSGSCSVSAADGMLYVHWQNGVVGLVEANPKEYKLAGHFKLQPKGNAWAHPVVIGGKLFIREEGTIYCYDVKAPAK